MRSFVPICLLLLAGPGQVPGRDGKGPPADTPSDAEQIIQLERSLEADREELKALRAEIDDPASAYRKAGAEFKKLDEQKEKLEEEIRQLKADGEAGEAAKREEQLGPLLKEWEAGKARYALAVKEHQAREGKAEALEAKIGEDQKALDLLTGKAKPEEPAGPDPAKPTAGEPPKAGPLIPGVPAAPPPPVTEEKAPENEEVARAAAEARRKAEEAREAADKAESFRARIERVRSGIQAEQHLLKVAEEKADLARKSRAEREAELKEKVAAGAGEKELEALRGKVRAEERALAGAQEETRASQARLSELRAELSLLQTDQLAALAEAERKRQEAEEAGGLVAILTSPFRPRNLLRWLADHGPPILTIVIAMLVLRWLVGLLTGRRISRAIARRERKRRHETEEARAETLSSVLRYGLTVAVVVIGTLMILDEVGLSITTLMGGAAVVGLAVSFGAQNLIKDYFTGFMVLMEDQYSVGDVVRINDHEGKVEQITLRVTVLRDLSGRAHFLPNGTITSVINSSHTWSRAFFEVGVAYKEDPNRVIAVLKELCAEVRRDEKFGPLILEDAEMLGVDGLTDSAVVIKFFIKTRPLKQWAVQREVLRRVKCRFDELGIEIPFPHRTVFVRPAADAGAPSGNGAAASAALHGADG